MVSVQTQPAVYAKLENRSGTLEHATSVLAEKKIPVDAITLETVGFMGAIRILTEKSQEAAEALRASGIEAHPSELLMATIPSSRPVELARIWAELAAAGVNVESVMTVRDGRLGVRTDNNELAERILGKL